jgi:hypothetical protein
MLMHCVDSAMRAPQKHAAAIVSLLPIQLLLAASITTFVPGSASAADQEVIPPTEAADSQTIIERIEQGINGAYALGMRPSMRDAHAKAHGCVRAQFTVDLNIPPDLRRGVFAEPKTYSAWVRFSNGAGTPHNDQSGDGRGMAVKLTGVPGTKLLPEQANAQTQDFLMINHPVFFVRNVADYVPFTQLSLLNKANEFLDTHLHEKSIVAAITSKAVDEAFTQRYYSMAPYMLGDKYVKFSARPVGCTSGTALAASDAPEPKDDPGFLRQRMVSWLSEKDACFKFAVQPQTDRTTQPIEDPTILWDEAKAPFIDVASIRIPKQTFDTDAQRTFCENLSYTPWHALPEHRPVGGINRLRKDLYEAISKLRHRLNKAPRVEPTGDETFN